MKLPPKGKTYALFGAIYAEAEKCFKVLLEYGRTFLTDKSPIDLTIPNISYYGEPTSESVVYMSVGWDTGSYVKSLHEIGVDLNERYPNPSGSGPKCVAIHYAVNFSMELTKLMISLGVSPNLDAHEQIILKTPYPGRLDRMLDDAKFLIVAGFDKAKVLQNFQRSIPWRQEGYDGLHVRIPLTEEDQDKIDKFVSDMTTYNSLQEHCREAIIKHLMSVRLDTNLFFLMPPLMVPGHDDIWMNDLLLYGLKL